MESNNLFAELCSYENLELAFKKARKRKSLKEDVIEFEGNLKENLTQLRIELLTHSYLPKPLITFVIRDPKTRKISKSDFRDRVVHHALCNIIEPIFDKSFIHDSYANRKGKGNLKALERFDYFKRKVSMNHARNCYVLKADIKHYFDEVDQNILVEIIAAKIKDERILWLVRVILNNHNVKNNKKGMPLGNLTSQFFANVYLNELDKFAKHILRAKFYIRYVDDFVIFSENKSVLNEQKQKIKEFLGKNLLLELHPNKCKVIEIKKGIDFLGFRVFYYHKLLRRKNTRKLRRKLDFYKVLCKENKISCDVLFAFIQGWNAYAVHGNTYKLRINIISEASLAV